MTCPLPSQPGVGHFFSFEPATEPPPFTCGNGEDGDGVGSAGACSPAPAAVPGGEKPTPTGSWGLHSEAEPPLLGTPDDCEPLDGGEEMAGTPAPAPPPLPLPLADRAGSPLRNEKRFAGCAGGNGTLGNGNCGGNANGASGGRSAKMLLSAGNGEEAGSSEGKLFSPAMELSAAIRLPGIEQFPLVAGDEPSSADMLKLGLETAFESPNGSAAERLACALMSSNNAFSRSLLALQKMHK